MSQTAEWMRERYVNKLNAEFFAAHGRWPDGAEEIAIWDKAFALADRDCRINQLEIV